MYEISVPIMCSTIKRGNRERLVSELKRFGTKRVFVALDKYETDEAKRREVMEELSENCKFFADFVHMGKILNSSCFSVRVNNLCNAGCKI